jgi:hypothetical protein
MGKDTAKKKVPMCPGCGMVLSPRWQQCPMCDARLSGPCPNCGNDTAPPGAPTCRQCGTAFFGAARGGDEDEED